MRLQSVTLHDVLSPLLKRRRVVIVPRVARTLQDAEIAYLLQSLSFVRAVHALDPPTSEFDYVAIAEAWGGAEMSEAHYRLLEGVGRARAVRVWFVSTDHLSAPRALERVIPIVLDQNERQIAASSLKARRARLDEERERHFRQLLAETIAWCRFGARAADDLRTPELCPALEDRERDADAYPRTPGSWSFAHATREARERSALVQLQTHDRLYAVAELSAHRARLLRERGLFPEVPAPDAGGGRLLLRRLAPRESAIAPSPTGTARCELAPNGFLDAFDCPPWDTWVSWEPRVQGGEAVVSWVPPELLPRAEEACAALRQPVVEWLHQPFLGIEGIGDPGS